MKSIRTDNWFYLLNQGAVALDWRLRAIDSATQSIDLQSFIWESDVFGDMVLAHLLAAADRGVRIRILIDDSFILTTDLTIVELNAHPNIEYRIFNPYKRRSSHVVTREVLNLGAFHRLDHRMHNKAMIVDNRIAIIGGRNIADQYFGLHSIANFRDLEVITGGSVVQGISNGYDRYWNSHWSFPADVLINSSKSKQVAETAKPAVLGNSELHLEEAPQIRAQKWRQIAEEAVNGTARLVLDNPPGKNPSMSDEAPVQLAEELVRMIDDADEEIWMVSAYLIPTPEFELAIERAEQSGVSVHILTNSIRSNNHITAHSAYRKHIHELLNHGADLHEVRVDAEDRGIYMQAPIDSKILALHAKILVTDHDKVFIGSANFDPRSLRINTEMGLIITSEALNRQVREAILPDFSPRNAWQLEYSDEGTVQWVSDDQRLNDQPAGSFMQRIEDWFFAHLPIEGEM